MQRIQRNWHGYNNMMKSCLDFGDPAIFKVIVVHKLPNLNLKLLVPHKYGITQTAGQITMYMYRSVASVFFENTVLTLIAPTITKVVCFSRLLKC